MDYRREIDGLRALAVLPVIFFHAGFQALSGGYVGVDVFFVISGFLITSIIIAELQAGNFSIAGFYERRARRILPALSAVVAVCIPLAWFWLLPGDMKDFSDSVVSVFLFVSNLLFWRTSGYFDTDTELKPLLHTWSLAVEEQYYVLFPVFLAVAWRFGRRWIVALLVVVALLSLLAAQWGSAVDPSATFYLLPTRGWELLIGALAAFHLSRHPLPVAAGSGRQLGALAGLGLIVYAILVFDSNTPFPSVYTLAPTVGSVLIILCATPQTWVGRLLGSRAFVGVGLVSYSAYLWHQPMFAFARHRTSHEPGAVLMFSLALLSLVAAYFSWKYVELPFRNRRRFGRRQIFGLSLAASLAFITFGIAGHVTTGFAGRYPADQRELATLQPREVGKYVSRRFNALRGKPFDTTDTRRKVLVIGDSFAQDLVNVVYESGLDRHLQLSTRHIGHQCGNLFMPQTQLLPNIAGADMPRCRDKGIFEDADLRARMQAADEIWFVSRWQTWQAPLIGRSVQDVQSFAAKPVRVFGRKDFGKIDIRALLAMDGAARQALRAPVGDETPAINQVLQAGLQPGVFVDLQALACGPEPKVCALFGQGAGLVSYDGGHLTPSGARFVGEGLLRLDWARSLMAGRPPT